MNLNNKHLALLRGVNVGGNAKINMAELKSAMVTAGYQDVISYINSGNIIFSANNSSTDVIAKNIEKVINDRFGFHVDVVVLSSDEWSKIIKNAPTWWGHDETRKHNLIVLFRPYSMNAVMATIGDLKPKIESAVAGVGVVYQSLSLKDFGKTTGGKLASSPIYKRMTIRNYNTATKLFDLLLK